MPGAAKPVVLIMFACSIHTAITFATNSTQFVLNLQASMYPHSQHCLYLLMHHIGIVHVHANVVHTAFAASVNSIWAVVGVELKLTRTLATGPCIMVHISLIFVWSADRVSSVNSDTTVST